MTNVPEPDWQPTLAGARLLLRPLAERDYDALLAAASDPLVWEQHPDRSRCTPEGFKPYFQSGLASKGALAVIDRNTEKIVGCSRFTAHDAKAASIEVGYTFLVRRLWGTGANAELKRLMLDHAFRFVEVVLFKVGPDNRRSRKALAKLGAQEIAAPGAACGPDARCPVVYRITRADWARR